MMQEKEANRQAEQGKAETEIPCAVCRDLIPLVQDGVASPESEALVKAHLQTCPECRTLWQAGGGQPFGASVNRQQGRRSNLGFGAHKRVQDFPPGHHAANAALEIIFGSRFQLFRRIGRVEPRKRQHSRIVPCQHMGEHPPAFNAPVRVPLQHRCLYTAVHIKRR